MIPPKLTGRTFRAMSNSTHGQSGPATEMQFTADDAYVTALYAGGGVRLGQVLGRRTDDDALDMHYHAGSTSGEIRAGHGRATFAADQQGKLRMFIEWQWLRGDHGAGHSEWVEVWPGTDEPSGD
jgi:hypothetical protein